MVLRIRSGAWVGFWFVLRLSGGQVAANEPAGAEVPTSAPASAAIATMPQGPQGADTDALPAGIGAGLKTVRGEVAIRGEAVGYVAVAGHLPLLKADGKPRAQVFFVSYLREGVEDRAKRPVLFSFNGGPGSSSVWLHLGTLGPRRVQLTENGSAPAAPYLLADNADSVLDAADLVFIDPVSTGYSQAEPGEDAKQFHGVDEDLDSVSDFIRLWLTRFERWPSPKYLIGESYGGIRAAGLCGRLQQRHGIYVSGAILLSPVIDFQTISGGGVNDLPYVCFLPALTATAAWHGRLEGVETADQALVRVREAEAFALGEYATALLAGSRLGQERRLAVAGELARLTGLSREFVLANHLRVDTSAFRKELLRSAGLNVGRFDSRLVGAEAMEAGQFPDFDPSYTAVQSVFTATINDYLRRELGVLTDAPYAVLSSAVQPWSYARFSNRYLGFGTVVRDALAQNEHLRVLVVSGYHDLATPYFAAAHSLAQLDLSGRHAARVSQVTYRGGHMMYTLGDVRAALGRDLSAWLRGEAIAEPVGAAGRVTGADGE